MASIDEEHPIIAPAGSVSQFDERGDGRAPYVGRQIDKHRRSERNLVESRALVAMQRLGTQLAECLDEHMIDVAGANHQHSRTLHTGN